MSVEVRNGLLSQAEFLIRTRGYAAFSYADLAKSSSIRKASIHHYFPKKENLASVLVTQYLERFKATLNDIELASSSTETRLRAYASLFLDGLENGMLPLCGALSAERAALPEDLQVLVAEFFRLHLDWLAKIVGRGIENGHLRADAPPERVALQLLSSLQGGSIVAWALGDARTVLSGFEDTLEDLANKPAPATGGAGRPKK